MDKQVVDTLISDIRAHEEGATLEDFSDHVAGAGAYHVAIDLLLHMCQLRIERKKKWWADAHMLTAIGNINNLVCEHPEFFGDPPAGRYALEVACEKLEALIAESKPAVEYICPVCSRGTDHMVRLRTKYAPTKDDLEERPEMEPVAHEILWCACGRDYTWFTVEEKL